MEGQEHMTQFVESLRETYRERQLLVEEQWPPVRGDKLINLQLVVADKTEDSVEACHNMALVVRRSYELRFFMTTCLELRKARSQ